MIDELRALFERALQQPESVQRHIAELAQQELEQAQQEATRPREALDSYAGAWSDLPEDGEIEALYQLRQ